MLTLLKSAKTVFTGTKLPAESAQFESNFGVILDLRKELIAIDAGVRKWVASSRELAKSAKLLGKTVRTPAKEVDALAAEMDTLLERPTNTILSTLAKKISMLDGVVKQRQHLKELRQNKENYEKKLAQLEEQDRIRQAKKHAVLGEFDVQILNVKHKITTCTEKYQTELTEVTASMDQLLEECGEEMGPKLVAPELATFRTNQFHFFVLCQKMIAGEMAPGDGLGEDLEQQWKAFQRKNSTCQANARVALLEDKDGEQHVKWSPTALIQDIPTKTTNGVEVMDTLNETAVAKSSSQDDDNTPLD